VAQMGLNPISSLCLSNILIPDATEKLSQSGHIHSFLLIVQNNLYAAVKKMLPGCFNTGVFCSANLFIYLLIDPHARRQSKGIYPSQDLFTVTEVRTAAFQI
jgi:hypothetical protein